MVDEAPSPPWLEAAGLLARFGAPHAEAVDRYKAFVAQGIGGNSIWRHLNRQIADFFGKTTKSNYNEFD